MKMSAPVPFCLSAVSCMIPPLSPMSVRISITCTPTTSAHKKVRTHRYFKFSQTSLLIIKKNGSLLAPLLLSCQKFSDNLRNWLVIDFHPPIQASYGLRIEMIGKHGERHLHAALLVHQSLTNHKTGVIRREC